ncbi:MAG: hypothetical protein Q8935_23200, partial [Bacillota bacterium]|nr:hypothetical protein [Bacillota bacterium]
ILACAKSITAAKTFGGTFFFLLSLIKALCFFIKFNWSLLINYSVILSISHQFSTPIINNEANF